jgi:HTH-type transcriptional regulator / antitoxin HipB
MARVRATSDLGNAIRGRRQDLAITQTDLANRIGVSRKWVQDIERGNPGAQLRFVLTALDVLGMRLILTQGKDDAGGAVDLDLLLNDYENE